MKFRFIPYIPYIGFVLLIISCSGVEAIFSTPTPTKTPEQVYSSQIQPTLEKLDTWINGPLADYEKALNIQVNNAGEITNDPNDLPLYGLLSVLWENPGAVSFSDGWDKALKQYLAPAAARASQSGFEVLSAFNGITPPPSTSTAHSQIVSCVQHKVELTAEIEKSINGSYAVPKSINDKDPCDLLEASIQTLAKIVEENK